MSIFLFNNFILYYLCCYFDNCNVDTHANIQPRGQLSEHMYCLYWRTVQLLRDRTVRSASVKKCPHTDRPQTGGLFNRDFFLIQLKCWRSCQYFFLFLTVCANGWAFKTLSDPSPLTSAQIPSLSYFFFYWSLPFVSSMRADLSTMLFSHVVESWKSTNTRNLWLIWNVLYSCHVVSQWPDQCT